MQVALQLSPFELLTTISELSDNLFPINFYQDAVEKLRQSNFYVKAFEKAQKHDFYSFEYVQPEHFSEQILGKKLDHTMVRLRIKLSKIKKAMRIVQGKEVNADTKDLITASKKYEQQRK